MATFAHTGGAYHVEASVNYFFKNNLLTDLPVFLTAQTGSVPPRTINFDYPEQPLVFPSFAITHLGSEAVPGHTFQGDRADGSHTGVPRFGLCEIDCWVTSKDNANWMMHLRVLRDMVFRLFQRTRAIPLYDFTVPTAPATQSAVVRVDASRGLREVATEPDPNPAVKRKRILLTYHWIERFT